MSKVTEGHRRVGRLTKIERETMSAAEQLLEPAGFAVEWIFGGKHPGVYATKDGLSYLLPASNSPSIPALEVKHMTRKCRKLLAGVWRPVSTPLLD